MMKKALFSMLIAFMFLPFVAEAQNAVIYTEEYKACDKFVWERNGKTYHSNAVDTFSVSSDTFYILNLAIFKSNSITLTPYATCDFTWRNKTYTSNTTIKDTLKNIHQCDSAITIILNLTKTNYDTTVVRTCRNYTFGGKEYKDNGLHNGYTTKNTALDCDSIHRLDLTIEPKVQRWEEVTQCNQYKWSINNVTYSQSASVDSVVTGGVCDSIIHLIYTKTNIYDTTVVNACNKYTYNKKKDYTESGYYNDTTYNDQRCMTVKTINLNIVTPREIADTLYKTACTAYQHTFKKNSSDTRVITIYDSVTKKTTTVKTSAISASTNHSAFIHGKYTNYTSAKTCYDSTINIHVTINYTNHVVENEVVCDKYVWNWKASDEPGAATKKTTFTKTGSDSVAVGKNIHNCDSFLVKKVTVNVSPIIESIQGKHKMVDGESVKLYAVCDQKDVKYRWLNGTQQISTKDTLVSSDFNKNTDITLIAINKNTNCSDTSWITVLYGVGIDDVDNTTLTLAPNPTAGNIVINCGEEMNMIYIYNTLGKEVLRKQVSGNITSLNVANLSQSVYTVRIELANGKQMVRQIIKNK